MVPYTFLLAHKIHYFTNILLRFFWKWDFPLLYIHRGNFTYFSTSWNSFKCLPSPSSTCAACSHHHRVEAEVHNIHSLSFSVYTCLPIYLLLLLLILKRKGAKMTFHHSCKNAEIVNNGFKLPTMRKLDRF